MSQTVTEQSDRFEIRVDDTVAGFTQFVDRDGQRIIFHTEVDEAFSGQGLGGTLVGQALDRTREAGLRVVPVCPYVEKYIGKHEEYADIADPVTDEARAAVPR